MLLKVNNGIEDYSDIFFFDDDINNIIKARKLEEFEGIKAFPVNNFNKNNYLVKEEVGAQLKDLIEKSKLPNYVISPGLNWTDVKSKGSAEAVLKKTPDETLKNGKFVLWYGNRINGCV